jgi:tetratricopeptide (TPR) repeat protein
MTETLISSLSQLPNLNVKARSSVFRYKGKEVDPKKIGAELSVQAILNGRVAQRGDRLTLTLELVDAQTENVIWSEQYNRKQADLVTLQREIAHDVSGKLKTKLSGTDAAKVTKTYTSNPEAYQLYLRGRFYWNKRNAENIGKAIEQFKAAVEKDPNYALAYVGLADCYGLLPEYAGATTSQTLPQAKAYASRALEIDDSLSEVHASLGFINEYLMNWSEAEKEYKKALELNPNYPTSHHWYNLLLRNKGRFTEALAEIQRAHELDPLSIIITANLVEGYLLLGDMDPAVEHSAKMMELEPNHWITHHRLGLVYLKQRRNAEALAEMKKSVELSNRSNSTLSYQGYVSALLGNRKEALDVIRELEERYEKHHEGGRDIAAVYAGLGERDQAFAWLEKDFQARSYSLQQVRWYFSLESLHSDSRFTDLLRRMGLPQ